MRKTLITTVVFASILVFSAPAEAQKRSGVGVGVDSGLITNVVDFGGPLPGAISVTYDTGGLYAGGTLTFFNIDDTVTFFGLGGRFYVPVHDGDQSDFAVGGAVTVLNSDPVVGSSDTNLMLEAGGRIRAWLSGNVSLEAGLGFGILVADDMGPNPNDNAFGLLGNLVGNLGLTYFFW